MTFTVMDYLSYFLFYACVGWIIEEIFYTIKEGRRVNRGFVNGPLCPLHGVSMVIIIWEFTGLSSYPLFQYIGCLVLFGVAECIAAVLGKLFAGTKIWNYESKYLNLDGRMSWIRALICGSIGAALLWFVNPFFYVTMNLIPEHVRFVVLVIVYIVFAIDLVVSLAAVLHIRWQKNKGIDSVTDELRKTSHMASKKFFKVIEGRMFKAFPELKNSKALDSYKQQDGFGKTVNRIFAEGICFDKLVWLFFISALLGDWIETLYVWGTTGILMSRSSLIYGTFSIVWGFGGALATALLYPLAKKNDRYIFIGGFLLGGIYEYSCSYIGEKFLGTKFWDYSDMKFNLDGRVNLLFCLFWGMLAIVWVKALYPVVSKPIEKLPPVFGKIATWLIVVVMALDMVVSGLAVVRYVDRKQNTNQVQNVVTDFVDNQYSDTLIERIYPNMRIVE